jgi:hypothetical protein
MDYYSAYHRPEIERIIYSWLKENGKVKPPEKINLNFNWGRHTIFLEISQKDNPCKGCRS